jgi:hypothetical protein
MPSKSPEATRHRARTASRARRDEVELPLRPYSSPCQQRSRSMRVPRSAEWRREATGRAVRDRVTCQRVSRRCCPFRIGRRWSARSARDGRRTRHHSCRGLIDRSAGRRGAGRYRERSGWVALSDAPALCSSRCSPDSRARASPISRPPEMKPLALARMAVASHSGRPTGVRTR